MAPGGSPSQQGSFWSERGESHATRRIRNNFTFIYLLKHYHVKEKGKVLISLLLLCVCVWVCSNVYMNYLKNTHTHTRLLATLILILWIISSCGADAEPFLCIEWIVCGFFIGLEKTFGLYNLSFPVHAWKNVWGHSQHKSMQQKWSQTSLQNQFKLSSSTKRRQTIVTNS